MTIRCIYTEQPSFPPTDNDPAASRVQVDVYWVDYTGSVPTLDDVNAVLHPPAVAHLNNGALIRFTATNPITVLENIGMAGVTRRAKGWFRALHQTPMPSAQYSVFPDILDALDKRVRVVARTVDYVDIKVVDAAGAAADATELSIKIERVIS